MDTNRFEPLGFQQISAVSLATQQSLTVPPGATMVLLGCDTANVRWRDDGIAPTATIGMLLPDGVEPFQYTGNLHEIQFIAATGSPVLNVSYYRAAG